VIKQPHPAALIHFILRAQQIAQQDAGLDKGYAMMVTSLVSIAMFTLLAAYMTLTNLSKSSTNAYIDGTNTFYVAESGLNKRAELLRQKFIDYALPSANGGSVNAAALPSIIANCFTTSTPTPTTNDFECRSYSFRYNNNAATSVGRDGSTVVSDVDNNPNSVNYTAYTIVSPAQDYSVTAPTTTTIPSGQAYAGLQAQVYKYTVYSTAAKPDLTNTTNPVQQSDAKTVLQMEFISRVVPLFQFAAFYEDDLEMDSQMPMAVTGPIHTNSDLMPMSYSINQDTAFTGGAVSATTITDDNLARGTRLLGKVTAAGKIYGGVASQTWHPSSCGSVSTGTPTKNCGVMAVYKGTGLKTDRANYYYFPDFTFKESATPALSSSQVTAFGDRMLDGLSGAKRLNPPKPGFLREKNYKTNEVGAYYGKADIRLKFFPGRAMPFNLTPIKSGTGCSISTNDIPADRQGASALSCTALTKGQLRSLQQPVLFTTSTTVSAADLNILKALKVAIASALGTPLTLNDLATTIDLTSTTLTGWQLTFRNLLTATERTLLGTQSPNAIVAARASSFLPPPIQLITGTAQSTDLNINGSFCNQLKRTSGTCTGGWMTMLQTNIGSLTVWNRDGIYVESTDPTNLTTAYAAPATVTLGLGLTTDSLAFIKSAADSSAVAGSFPHLGLAAADRTEGGLVIHATVSDDTNGDGTNDITTAATDPIPGKDANGNTIAYVDRYRRYPATTGIRQSPYAFVFNGGVELPAPLTIATDGAAYIQGDYNNPGVAPGTLPQAPAYLPSNTASLDRGFRRQPAAIIADTITVLSNQCVNNNGRVGRIITGSTPFNCGGDTTISTVGTGAQVANGIAINAAFLSNLMKSGVRNSDGTYTAGSLNGGLNKYMRLLENWGGSSSGTFYNYTGSMVSLGEPLESGELPTGAGVPQRNFNYETRFDVFNSLPPLTPSAIYLQQDVFKRSYN
jgi:Tfp pilus assembly protein PilX